MSTRSHRPRPSPIKAVTGLLAVVLGAAACTGSGSDVITAEPTTITTTETTATTQPTVSTTAPTTQPSPATPPESLPGDLIEFGPAQGDELDVVGVAFDDVLNVRIAPGTDFDLIGTLDPDTTGVTATGHNRLLPDSLWVEVDFEGQLGWVNEKFVGYLGSTRALQPSVPAANATALEMAQLVAESAASVDPPSTITVAAQPLDGVVIMDVIGLGDDAAKGFRLTVTTVETAGKRSVTAVDEQIICSRGKTDDGLCV